MSETTQPATQPTKPKTIYDWDGQEDDCPDDIVVCAGNRPLILQAEAYPEVKKDSPRIEPGDRRQGAYYVGLMRLEVGTSMQRLKGMKLDRVLELEKTSQIRTGDRPADWVLIARKRGAEGHDPGTTDNINQAMANLNAAARRW
jgi:hypothetical protein